MTLFKPAMKKICCLFLFLPVLAIAQKTDRRLERIGLPARYNAPNPFPWMSETIDLKKEKNFFETRVTEYQSGGALSWD